MKYVKAYLTYVFRTLKWNYRAWQNKNYFEALNQIDNVIIPTYTLPAGPLRWYRAEKERMFWIEIARRARNKPRNFDLIRQLTYSPISPYKQHKQGQNQ